MLGVQVLVQVGDVLDRGDDEIAILSLLACLNKQAHSKGGAVFQVLFFSLCYFTELCMLHNIATTNCLNPKPTPSSMKIILCLINSIALQKTKLVESTRPRCTSSSTPLQDHRGRNETMRIALPIQ